MPLDRLLIRDVIGGFASGQPLRAALLLTYSFDGRWFEEALAPELFERRIDHALIIRDQNVLIHELPSVRCHRANAAASRVFHPKLLLLVSEDRALAALGSANLTRGGFERNLELGLMHEVSPEGGPKGLFEKLRNCLAGPVQQEVGGSSLEALRETVIALDEVLSKVPGESEQPRQFFLHSYDKPLWEQILERLPHKHIRSATIVSPFFEPDTSADVEDPMEDYSDASIFHRMFDDLTFEPKAGEGSVAIYFQHDSGATLLPLKKLERWRDRIELHARRDDSADPRRLHGKLLILEGARGPGREPFVVTLHGSPNFTAAALLGRAPADNAEMAILTHLPARRNSSERIATALGLPMLFAPISDWNALRSKATLRPTLARREELAVLDATLKVAEQQLRLLFHGQTSAAVGIRVRLEREGAWVVLAEARLQGNASSLLLDVPGLMAREIGDIQALVTSRLRIEWVDSAGEVLTVQHVPINVDCPQQFCGLAMVGPAAATLDQRIAQAGSGTPMTYREQQRWLEQLRAARTETGRPLGVLTHQADLDRFYRNLHTGFRGLRARVQATPRSEFMLRRNLRDLTRWLQEAVAADSKLPGDECRLFLVDRLGRELSSMLQHATETVELAERSGPITRELEVVTVLDAASSWLKALPDARLGAYLFQARERLRLLRSSLAKEVAP